MVPRMVMLRGSGTFKRWGLGSQRHTPAFSFQSYHVTPSALRGDGGGCPHQSHKHAVWIFSLQNCELNKLVFFISSPVLGVSL